MGYWDIGDINVGDINYNSHECIIAMNAQEMTESCASHVLV